MRRTPRDLADAREELLEIQQEFVRLQKRIDVVRDCITDSLTRIFGDERPAIAMLAEEELIEKLAVRVAAWMGSTVRTERQGEKRYVHDTEAAKLLGVSAKTLRSWRGKRPHIGPPVTRIDRMVLYSVKELERFMEARTIGGRN